MNQDQIRNFSIIAHIDHGKTTLTDQLLKLTNTISERDSVDRILDSNPIEKERGITIKLAPVTMTIEKDNENYQLNLIDTPGHVDFSYEVSRSLAACEGAILLVDATQGIQAQTLAHAKKAFDLGLVILPILNKIDLESAQISESEAQLREVFGFKPEEILKVSAKTGIGVKELLQQIIEILPAPSGQPTQPSRIVVFNSIYDQHLGVIAFVRIVDGSVSLVQKLYSIEGKKEIECKELGIFTPNRTPLNTLHAGQVGYIATGLKNIRSLQVGDTLTSEQDVKKRKPLPGFKVPKPMIFADIYPSTNENFNNLKYATEKLQLMDASLITKLIHSPSLGGGFRLGFLGLFHAEITRERLEREMGVVTIITKPTVEYSVHLTDGSMRNIQHASELPDLTMVSQIKEPMVEALIFSPREYIGSIMQVLQEKRGTYKDTQYFGNQVQLLYHLPLSELIGGVVDELKTVSKGYASIDYEHIDSEEVDAVKLSIRINHEEVEMLLRIVARQDAQQVGRELVEKLKEVLPRQLFAVPIQAAIGGKIIARETKPAARKDVTAKLYGGDRTRRMKLLEKQKKGKKRLALSGKVNIPPETYTKLLRV